MKRSLFQIIAIGLIFAGLLWIDGRMMQDILLPVPRPMDLPYTCLAYHNDYTLRFDWDFNGLHVDFYDRPECYRFDPNPTPPAYAP